MNSCQPCPGCEDSDPFAENHEYNNCEAIDEKYSCESSCNDFCISIRQNPIQHFEAESERYCLFTWNLSADCFVAVRRLTKICNDQEF